MSGIINKVKDVLHKDKSHTTTTGTSEGVAGPHTSHAANAADPRVDSDLDGSRKLGSGTTTGAYGSTVGSHTAGTGLDGTTGHHHGAPVHNSTLGNKADPRIDSDADGSRNFGATQASTHDTYGNKVHSSTAGAPIHSSNAGAPVHNSNLLNKTDPRIDSDADGSRNFGATQGHVGNTYTGSAATNVPGYTAGSGAAPTTAGPHDSNILNKVDPRVDSDLDGSKTVGGNKTFN